MAVPDGRVSPMIRRRRSAGEFGTWFRVKFDGPFAVGRTIKGKIAIPGYEHVTMEVAVERMDAENFFSYGWHPAAIDPKKDYSSEPTTLVEFRLEDAPNGTTLTIVESGFDTIPLGRRDAAPLFAALGDETRLELIMRLASGGPGSITHLTENAAVSRQAITKHLRVLSEAELVRSTRRGRETVWALEPKPLADAHAHLDRISQQWDDALDRLRAFVEDE